jgi:hypothetical protein
MPSPPAPAVAAADEALHAPETDRDWSESFYQTFFDERGGVAGAVRLALSGRDRQPDGLVVLRPPGGGVLLARPAGRGRAGSGTGIGAGPLELECEEPLSRLRIRFDGECRFLPEPERLPDFAARLDELESRRLELDLVAESDRAAAYYPPYRRVPSAAPAPPEAAPGLVRRLRRALRRPREIARALRMRGGRHYEQPMRVSGEYRVDGAGGRFRGTGHRDHSWGVRDWSVATRWRWLTGSVGETAFSAMFLTTAGSHVVNGLVWRGSGVELPLEMRLDASFHAGGFGGRDVCLELGTGADRILVTGEVADNVVLPISGDGYDIRYSIGFTRYRLGGQTGLGVAEFLERVHP